MSSQQDARAKELRAEEAARTAAAELRDINKQRGTVGHETRPDENRQGFIGSIFQSAKDVVTGKTHEATDKATIVSRQTAERERQNKDYAAQKARETADKTKEATMGKMVEYKDNAVEKSKETAEKAKEAKDYTADKAKEAKDATMGKMGEYKDYTADKAKEAKDYTVDKSAQGKDSAVGKLGELKDKAMDFFSGNKDEIPKGTGSSYETEEEAKRKLETMQLKAKGYEAKGTRMETTVAEVDPVRATSEAFRKADQMSGQSFNDVGAMDDDSAKGGGGGGVYRVQLKKHDKK